MQSDDKCSEYMPKINIEKDEKLKKVDRLFMKEIEQLNVQRALQYQRQRKRTGILGISLMLGVVGIYVYTLHSVKQETFLNDFNEPETVIENPISQN